MKYRKIETRIWNDAKFRSISDDAKLAFLFVLTHPGMTSLGAMRGTIGGLAEELGWTRERLSEAFEEAFRKGLLKGDFGGCLIWAPNFLKYNAPESPNVVKSWAHGFNDLPECDLKHDVLRCAIAVSRSMTTAFKKAFDESFKSLIEGLPKPSESLSKGFANQEPKAPVARAEQLARSSPGKGSVDAPRQTLDGTPSASDGPKKEQEPLGSFSFSNHGDAKRQPQELAQQQEIVGDQPDWMLTPSEIEQEKAFIESAGKILDRWQRTRNGKRGVARIRTLKTGKQILGDISPNDKKALRSFLPNRLDAAIEALEAIDEGAIGFNANPIGLQFFANNIDRILAGSLAEFDQSRKRTRTDDIKDNLAEVRSELHEFASNPKPQQKRLS